METQQVEIKQVVLEEVRFLLKMTTILSKGKTKIHLKNRFQKQFAPINRRMIFDTFAIENKFFFLSRICLRKSQHTLMTKISVK